jgi:hypothetical protein
MEVVLVVTACSPPCRSRRRAFRARPLHDPSESATRLRLMPHKHPEDVGVRIFRTRRENSPQGPNGQQCKYQRRLVTTILPMPPTNIPFRDGTLICILALFGGNMHETKSREPLKDHERAQFERYAAEIFSRMGWISTPPVGVRPRTAG